MASTARVVKGGYLERARSIAAAAYDYGLPEALIAFRPLPDRGASRLLVVRGASDRISDRLFTDLPQLLPPRSKLVMNSSRVIPARVAMRKQTGGKSEVMMLSPVDAVDPGHALYGQSWNRDWKCLVGGRKVRKGDVLSTPVVGPNLKAPPCVLRAAVHRRFGPYAIISFSLDGGVEGWAQSLPGSSVDAPHLGEVLKLAGTTPLPPYIKRDVEVADVDTYQTVYADREGSVAAPTAGLHMTKEVLAKLEERGVSTSHLTLHVGAGTFAQMGSDTTGEHSMHEERISVPRATVQELIDHISLRRPIVALGTTSVRTLESLYWFGVRLLAKEQDAPPDMLRVSQWEPYERLDALSIGSLPTPIESLQAVVAWNPHGEDTIFGETRLLIVPGVDALVTNFHQPRSTLLMLVSAFLGGSARDLKRVYTHAIEEKYRFLSYGDSSLYAPSGFFDLET